MANQKHSRILSTFMQNPRANHHLPPGEGHILDYHNLGTVLPDLIKLNKQYGDHFKAKFPGQDSWVYTLINPEMAKHILIKNPRNYRKGVGTGQINVLLGRGIIVSEGDLWKRQRKMMQPMFSKEVLKQLVPLMTRCTEQYLQEWHASAAAGAAINITEATSNTALNFILYALFSEDLSRIIEESGGNPFLLVADESARDLQFARRFRKLTTVIINMIEHRNKDNRRPFDFLSMVMDAAEKSTGKPMPQNLQLDEILTMIIAGHETTASALNWTWYLIAQHPEVEQRLLDEARQVLNGNTPTHEDLSQLTYTRQVLEEAMRLYPPVWTLTRRAITEDEICGFYVPEGTDILIPPYLVHRHLDFWHDPERFDPERFSAEQKAGRHQAAYLPFAIGPRNCIGEAMAFNEMIIHVSMVIQKMHFELVPEQTIELEALVNLRPKHDLYLRATTQ
jgi:cytochrome P450